MIAICSMKTTRGKERDQQSSPPDKKAIERVVQYVDAQSNEGD
jgi:hypothetical protein